MDEGQRLSIGAVIRTMREALGMTRQELAEAGSADPDQRVSVEMIAKVEQGRKAPSAKTLRKLAAGLGVDPLELSSSAARWEAAAAAGAGLGALRAALTGGTLGARIAAPFGMRTGFGVAPVALNIAAVAGGLALQEGRERAQWARLLEARLAELLERGSPEDIQHALATLDKVLPDPPTDAYGG
jgi:transcriptional regulator with XRE-family HTH domain